MVEIHILRPRIDPEKLADVYNFKGDLGKIYRQVNAAIKPLVTKYPEEKDRCQLEAAMILMMVAMCMQKENWGEILGAWKFMQQFGDDVMRCMADTDGAATTMPQKEGPDPAKMN